jgi:NitT/TauT family transport system ATP-binding protein
MESANLVEFRSVSKRFGGGPVVLDRISFSAKPGEFVSLIGPSGCGKSTLLRIIAGLTEATDGVVSVAGKSPHEAAADLAFVFQEPTLLPWLTVAQNIEMPLRLQRVPRTERAAAVTQALNWVRLADKADAYPRQLSGGQKMRVSIARALSLTPRLLLLDEPFGALDEMSREHLNEELLTLHQEQGWTAFFVTHSVAEAVFLSDRVIVLAANPGRIYADISVNLSPHRTNDTRLSTAYQEMVTSVSRVLRTLEATSFDTPAATNT